MEKSEKIDELAKALSLAQSEFEPVKKTARNPFFKSKYATLDNVIGATKKALKNNGLSVVQIPDEDGLTTILMHNSGEWISGNTKLYLDKSNAQGHGSAITYARRYALSSFLNIASEEDDDGNNASKDSKKPVQKKSVVNPPKETLPIKARPEAVKDIETRCSQVTTLEQWDELEKYFISQKANPAEMEMYNRLRTTWEELDAQKLMNK